MNSFTRRLAVTGVLFVLFGLICYRPAWGYSDLIVLGDSLSDTGNLASVSTRFPPPYYENRVSNGPLAVDALAAEFGLSAAPSLHLVSAQGGGNFAVDGAAAFETETHDLRQQLQSHLDRQAGLALKGALYVMMIGGNDLRSARNSASNSDAHAIVDGAVREIGNSLSTLLQRGASSVLVVNAPDIGKIPETLQKVQQDPGIIARSTSLVKRFNTALASTVKSLRSQHGAVIYEFDLFDYFNQLLDQAQHHGFTNTTEACFNPNSYSFHVDCQYGQRFDRFVFFDSIHPSAKTHALIGKAMAAAIPQASQTISISPILMLLLN